MNILPQPRLSRSKLATVSNQRPYFNNLEPDRMGDSCSGAGSDDLIGVCLDGPQQFALLLGPDKLQAQTNAAETRAAGDPDSGRITFHAQVC